MITTPSNRTASRRCSSSSRAIPYVYICIYIYRYIYIYIERERERARVPRRANARPASAAPVAPARFLPRAAPGHPSPGPGCRVQGSGSRVQGSEFRVQGSGCRVQGAGCRVQGAGFRVGVLDGARCTPESRVTLWWGYKPRALCWVTHTHTRARACERECQSV